MDDAPIVAVRGEVFREVDPELATFAVSVSARDKDRQATLRRLTERHDAVRAMLDGYAEAIERRDTSGVNVHPDAKRTGERISGYTGVVTTTVTVTDFAVLGELMLRLSDQDQTSVYGPWWSLRPDSPVYQQARREAIGEALRRAREYAEALGAHITRLQQLADTGLSGPPQVGSFQLLSAAPGMARGGADVPQLNLDPQRQTVQAQIEARFEISEPTALRQAPDKPVAPAAGSV